MSEPISALPGAEFEGAARVIEQGPQGMITLRGDLSSNGLIGAVKSVTGLDIPGQRRVETSGDKTVTWMSPDELLILLPHGEAATATAALSEALKAEHALAVEVSDARAVFQVSGPNAREVMAKLVPVDLHADAFQPGQIRRTHLAQVPAAFWLVADDTFRIVCFRSVARYVFDVLSAAAADGGEVGVF